MLICIGEILVDIFDDGNSRTTLPGGAPFNVACNASLYTKKVAFIGAVGNDEDGRLLLNTAKEKKLAFTNIKVLDDCYTSKAIVTLDNGERSFRFDRAGGADYKLEASDIDIHRVKDGDIIHLGSLMLSSEEGRLFYHRIIDEIRRFCRVNISFDINYRDDVFTSPDEAKKIFIDALKKADILKFSEDEIKLLSDKEDIVEGLHSLLNDKQLAVVTLGSKGSLLYKDGKVIQVDTYPVKPVDTTGAGDAFYSYFLASLVNYPNFINNKEEIIKYLRRANVAGGLCTLKKGAINTAPSEEEINRFINVQK